MHRIQSGDKIRVLRLLSRMNVGGPSRHVVHLAKELSLMGYETRLLVGIPESDEGSMVRLAEEAGVSFSVVADLDRPISILRDFKAFKDIVRHIYLFKPHIVHTHTTKVGILGRMAAIFCGVPVIFHTFHGHVFSGYFSENTSRFVVALERILARFTDRIITLTDGLKQDIAERFGVTERQNIDVVPLGLDLSKNLNRVRNLSGWRKCLGLGSEVFLAGIVARLVPVKNHAMLIGAVAKVVKEIPDFHLAVIGGGELEAPLKALAASLGVAGHVHFCGIVDEIEDVYADLNLLILSSKNEGTPVVLIEAVASGCPVAATKVGGIPEVLENGKYGFMLDSVPELFAEQLAKAVRASRDIAALSSGDRQRFAANYSVAALAKRTDSLYRKSLKLRGINIE